MAGTNKSKAKKAPVPVAPDGDAALTQILKAQSGSSSLLRIPANSGSTGHASTHDDPADTGLFYNLEQMLSTLIHSGKHYLGPIKDYASLIQDDNHEETNTRRWADKIVHNVDQMETYLEQLGALRINGALEVAEVSWQRLLGNVVAQISSINKKGAVVEVENRIRRPFVQREELLRRVLVHLATNAYEGVAREGTIQITVDEKEEEARRAVVTIADNGCGIDEKDGELVWKPFYTTKHDHVGLGLPYVAMAAPILGMDVELKSKTGRGTTITLALEEQGGHVEKETSGC